MQPNFPKNAINLDFSVVDFFKSTSLRLLGYADRSLRQDKTVI